MARSARKPPKGGVLVSDVIEGLRRDLLGSMTARDDSWEPLFDITDVQIDLTCTAVEDAKLTGGVRLYVVTLGSDLAEQTTVTQKISLKLRPSQPTPSVRMPKHDPLARGTARGGGNRGR